MVRIQGRGHQAVFDYPWRFSIHCALYIYCCRNDTKDKLSGHVWPSRSIVACVKRRQEYHTWYHTLFLKKHTVSVTIPRKTYLDFMADIFPDTRSNFLADAFPQKEWLAGSEAHVKLMSLDPIKRKPAAVTPTQSLGKNPPSVSPETTAPIVMSTFAPAKSSTHVSPTAEEKEDLVEESSSQRNSVKLPRSSLFRFTTGKCSAYNRMDSLSNLSHSIPNECDAIAVSKQFIFFPVQGPAGRLGIYGNSNFGRFPPAGVSCLVSGSDIWDFKVDKSRPDRVYVACDDGHVNVWDLDGGHDLSTDSQVPTYSFTAHPCRTSLLYLHPLVKDVLFTVFA